MTEGGPLDAVGEARRRAELLVSAGRPREAVALLERALAGAPDDSATLCQLSLAYLHAGERERQLTVANRAAAADPESEWAQRLRCDALGALGRKAEALEAAEQAVALAPREPLALLCLVNALRRTGYRWADAEARAEDLVALAPARASSHDARALVALERGRLADAEAGMRRALALEPETASYHNNLGLILLRQERRAEAVAAFERAAQIDPTMRVAQENLSVGLRSHLHRGLRGLVTDGVMGLIPGAHRPELAGLRRVVAGVILAAMIAGFCLGMKYAPEHFPSIFLVVLLGAAVIAPRLRLRRMSPTVQQFAASRRLAAPRFSALRRLLRALVPLSSWSAIVIAAVIVADPEARQGAAGWTLVAAGAAGAVFVGWRAVRRRRRDRAGG